MVNNRRNFLKSCFSLLFIDFKREKYVYTVKGKILASSMDLTLIHEHILVDFIGADKITFERWDRKKVVDKMLHYLLEAKDKGVKTLLDCTPAFLGRDVFLLKEMMEKSGLQILTNTGYYCARNYIFLPPSAFNESAEEIAKRWINEFKNGIDGTEIKPSFIKIGVNGGALSALEQKIVTAAAITHLATGLTICSHTGPYIAALEQINLLKKHGVSPSAFVWVHAQSEFKKHTYTEAAKMGAWVSLDGLGWGSWENYAQWLDTLKANKCLNRVLISHDAGWFDPAKENGGEPKGFTYIFDELLPNLKKINFRQRDIHQLLVKNPAEAFGINIRKL
jgi:phosphotriesterase-related protein